MNRKDFLKAGALTGAGSFVSSQYAFAENLTNNSIDRLVDADGNYLQQALPYAENFLQCARIIGPETNL